MSDRTHVCMILDRSGSMGTCRESTIDAVNRYLLEAKADDALADRRAELLAARRRRAVVAKRKRAKRPEFRTPLRITFMLLSRERES